MAKGLLQWIVACGVTLALFAAGGWLGHGSASAAPVAAAGYGAGSGADGSRPLQPYPTRTAEGELALGDALSVDGQPMQLSMFFTGDPPEKVIAWYKDALTRKGLIPFARAEARAGHVSVFDPEDGLQRFVTALPQGDGETLVMIGAADPRRPPRLLAGAKGAPFPVPEQQRGFLWYSADDAGVRAHNAQFVSSLGAGEVLAFYRKSLHAEGYAEAAAEGTAAMALFRKAGVSVSVSVQELGDQGGAAVFVSRIEGGAR